MMKARKLVAPIGAPWEQAERATDVDMSLWHKVQRIVYPKEMPSDGLPYAAKTCGPGRRPASWLYHVLRSGGVSGFFTQYGRDVTAV